LIGLSTYVKVSGNVANINTEKIVENLSLKYYVSDVNAATTLNKLFTKQFDNDTLNELTNDNTQINYYLVYEIINWCV